MNPHIISVTCKSDSRSSLFVQTKPTYNNAPTAPRKAKVNGTCQ